MNSCAVMALAAPNAYPGEDLDMKIKLVTFNDIDADGSNEIDYGLFIGKIYNVVDRDIGFGSFTIINDVGRQVIVYRDEVEVQL